MERLYVAVTIMNQQSQSEILKISVFKEHLSIHHTFYGWAGYSNTTFFFLILRNKYILMGMNTVWVQPYNDQGLRLQTVIKRQQYTVYI